MKNTNTKSKSDGFKRGSGCFKCESCSKLTRLTAASEQGSKICNLCYESAGFSNELSDSGYSSSPLAGEFGDVFEVFSKCENLIEAYDLFSRLRVQLAAYKANR